MEGGLAAPPAAEQLSAVLTTRWLGRSYEWWPACASTNDLAGERARGGAPAGLVIAADQQTAGRGRLGRTWHSPPGANLYVSILLRPSRPPPEIPPLTLLAGGALASSLAVLGFAPRLKWPNDVELVDDQTTPLGRDSEAGRRRKVAGILTEMSSAGDRALHVVLGVGLNVNGVDFPPEIAERATSLRRAAGGRPLDRAAVLGTFLNHLEPLLDEYERRGPSVAIAAFEAHAALPAPCRVTAPGRPNERLEGVALGVDPDGALRLRDETGHIHRVLSGEIQT
ncbi:MAG TPA: biotin--[acetyl-CoA-carboxylase] ligase [Polyangia bacterium]|nr:biotin--[acetyl-CoA-carboxylase] ligase [Polyangia bacterium]